MYLVTFVTKNRRRLFDDPEQAMAFCRACADRRSWSDARLLARVLMPDHWHGLIGLGERESLSRVVQRLKASTAKAVDAPAPVWQAGFHDRAIRGERSLLAAARYLVANPLRAGRVDSIGLWPWWDAVWL
jgi:REP element-mobilizing transposase RayT